MSALGMAKKARPKARGMKGGKSITKRAEDSPASASGKKMPGYNMFAMGKSGMGKGGMGKGAKKGKK